MEKLMSIAQHLRLSMATLCLAVLTTTLSLAQDFPIRQITLIAPWPAGGAVDALSRILATPLGVRLGKPIVVENRPGAASIAGTAAGAKALPDGYTLVMAGSGALAIGPALFKSLPFDPQKSFAPIALVAEIPFVLVVHPSLPVHSVSDLITYAKRNPNKLTYGSGGSGSPHHLYAELLKGMSGIEMTHVPYKGSAPALTDVAAGHIAVLFSDTVPSLPLIHEGKVRAIGVSSAARLPSAPEILPIAENGLPGFDAAGWGLIAAPSGTSFEVVQRLHAEITAVLLLSEVQQSIVRLGMVPRGNMPLSSLSGFVSAEIARWSKIVKQAGLVGSQ
jgi:tripartite-type tricarboxylate transporter receptor subunit TctC